MKNRDNPVQNVDPLTTTRWAQQYPYNYQLTLLPGHTMTSPVGCVGVAGGQIMAFHKHPEKAQGVIEDQSITLNIDGFEYDWEGMRDKITSTSEQRSIDAVSNLLYHQNITAQTSGAAGNTEKLFEAFVSNFSYNRHIGHVDLRKWKESYFSFAELQELVKSELKAGRPVQVSIPGHAVVCDGFREDGYFSFNWGWGGSQVWHKLDDSKDGCSPVQAYLNIRPDYKNKVELVGKYNDTITLNPLDACQLKFSLKNTQEDEVCGSIRLCLYDKNNVRRNILTPEINVKVNNLETKEFIIDCHVPDNATFGERCIVIEFQSSDLKWAPVSYANENVVLIAANIERSFSDDLIIQYTNVPSEVIENDSIDIEVGITSKIALSAILKVLLVDESTNSYDCIGSSDVHLNSDSINSIVIPVSFSDVKPQNMHKLIFVITESDEVNTQSAKQIASAQGYNSWCIYVKNRYVEYSEDYVLRSNLDKSIMYFAGGMYNYNMTVILSNDIPVPHIAHCVVRIVDEKNNILALSSAYLLYNSDFRIGELSGSIILPELSNDETESERDVVIQVLVENDEQYLLLTPEDVSVKNPEVIKLHYRNNYDYVVITSDLVLNSDKFVHDETFEIKFPLLWTGENHDATAMIGTAVVCIKDDNGTITELGSSKAAATTVSAYPNKVNCEISKSIAIGSYELFIQFRDASSENGPVRPKVLGISESTIVSLTINIV
ncbi:C10 family peptidase (plasmid) [Enterobacter sp. JS8-1]|uniref:C10 family peptidase n=1 Tax=Enterobacter sp. JS8-1 TaxID=3411633 RepID=UPI003BA1BFFB